MNSLAVLVPVKSRGAKSRLAGFLSPDERREFATLLLTEVLNALAGAGLASDSYVVSSDAEILSLASRLGAGKIREPSDRGVNSAVEFGMRGTPEYQSLLVLPSDLPLLEPADIQELLSLKSLGLDVVVAPSLAFDGTNALLFARAAPITLSYDDNSFWRHISSASRRGLSLGVSSRPGVMFDVDSPEDFAKLAKAQVKKPSVEFARKTLA